MLKNHKTFFKVLSVCLVLYFSLVGFWTGFFTKLQIESYVKDKTGLSISLGLTYLYPFSGNGFIKNIELANPAGFSSKNLLSIGEIEFKGNRKTLYGDVAQIESMKIKGIEIYFEPREGGNNIQKLVTNGSAFYHGDESDHDNWFKRMHIGQLDIDSIKIIFGPAILNKNTTLDAVSLGEIGTAADGIGIRRFGQLLIDAYISALQKTPEIANSPLILQWLEAHKST